jgi:hypothetical protein
MDRQGLWWLGKSFAADRERGENRFDPRFRLVTRLLWPLYRSARLVLRWSGRRDNGSYYEFDGRRIRVTFDDNDVWFGAADVFDVLGTADDARQVERVRLIVGRDGLQQAPGGVLSFSEKGLAAWLHRRTERRAGQFARWVETQVLAPYRRRRELERAEGG